MNRSSRRLHLIYFETHATRYSVAAARVDGKPDLILYCFGFCGASMTAALVPVDVEPTSFEHFCEQFRRHELSETDLWVGFMVLRHLLSYPTTFDQLRGFLQSEALTYTIEVCYYEHGEDTMPSKVEQQAFLAIEVERWPAEWQQQLQPLRDDLGLAIYLR